MPFLINTFLYATSSLRTLMTWADGTQTTWGNLTNAEWSGQGSDIDNVFKTVWYSAIDSTIIQTGGKITSISDLSGNNNTLTLSSGVINECSYSPSYQRANGLPAFVFSNTSNDTNFRVAGNITIQDFYIVCMYKDGQQDHFDSNESLLVGTGSFGSPKISGSTGAQFFGGWVSPSSASTLASSNNGIPVQKIMLQGLGMAVYRFTAAVPNTDRFYFFGGANIPIAWNGHICEVIGLPSIADTGTASLIINYLMNKYNVIQNSLLHISQGQSLAVGIVSNAQDQFVTEGFAQGFTNVKLINGGKNSAAILYQADAGAGAFLDITDTGPGALFTPNILNTVAASGIAWQDITSVSYLIGNTDADALSNGLITEPQEKAGYKTLIDLVRAYAINAIHVAIPNLGDNLQTTTSQNNAWTAVRRAQWQDMNENDYILDCFGTWDIPRTDSKHPTTPGYITLAQQIVRVCAHHLGFGNPNNPLGAKIVSAIFSPSTSSVTITVAFDPDGNATLFTMTNPFRFNIYKGATTYIPNAVTVNSANSFTLSGGGMFFTHGDAVTLDWPGGSGADMSITNLFLDNATNQLPLMPIFGLNVAEGV